MFLLSCKEVDLLVEHGWVDFHGCDMYTICQHAAKFLMPALTYKHGTSLAKYSGCTDSNKMTLLELMQLLSQTGWHEVKSNNAKQEEPFVKNGLKVWYSPEARPPFRSYLQCMLQAKAILETDKVTDSIHHGQLDARLATAQD